MNTLFSSVSGNSFRKALASVAFVAAVLAAPALSAQSVTAKGNVPSITSASATEFQAFVHPVENTVSMKVHFVNPAKESVNITIHNQDNKIVYERAIGKDEIFHGKFDLSNLADGEYTVKVSGRKKTYTRTLSIHTQQERLASAR
jgi:flagellar hook assembly protein FlgD